MGIKTLVSPVWWLLKKIWWVVDGMRRALFNLILLLLLVVELAHQKMNLVELY